MRRETLKAVVNWQNGLDGGKAREITFHGGEPLMPGVEFYRIALPLLYEGRDPRRIQFGVQSNLWLLTDELCELFREYDVSLATSLDGPKPINDAQRGQGYFQHTMAGIERACTHGIDVGCICTFTPQSALQARDVFDFFVHNGVDFAIHAALRSLRAPDKSWSLSPKAHGQLLVDMLEYYLANADKVRISTLDAMCRSISTGRGGMCTFGDCLGEYLAVDPEGWIYVCQRFAGMPEYRLGNVHDCPSIEMLTTAPVWQMFRERQDRIETECGDCPYLNLCRGGCPYNVLAINGGSFDQTLRDPHCLAYQRVFSHITDRALDEVFSKENLTAVVEKGPGKYSMMHKGTLLRIMRGGPHPQKVARRAREVVAAVALAVSESPQDALHKLDHVGLISWSEMALQSLKALRRRFDTRSQKGLVNAYIHVTYICNLVCAHCYACSNPGEQVTMAVDSVVRLVYEAADAGFRKVVITGGEPLTHPQREELLDALAVLRDKIRPTQTVLRTNLVCRLTPVLIEWLAHGADQTVVSVDGDQASHDARRGIGTYARTVENLRMLLAAKPTTEIGIAAALTAEQMGGQEGKSVRALAEKLGIRVRFKSVLPLGRGGGWELAPAFYNSLDGDAEAVVCGARLTATCGLGMNLYVGPNGECYPCYALMDARHNLGNALDGLTAALERNDIYRHVTVDNNRQCRHCALRYLCGGFCRVWGSNGDLNDAPLTGCTVQHERAYGLLLSALETLDVDIEHWLAANLPLPETPLKVS